MQKVTPFLWFDNNLEEAFQFYSEIFPNCEILDISRGQAGQVFTGTIAIEGQTLMALNGGPMYTFNESFSLFVSCDTQEEVDLYWDCLIADGGKPGRCGWLKDKFGMSWQIIPKALGEMMAHPDRDKASRAMDAMLQMDKIIIADLENA
jgi:predicted 3-demethylubiquinone-9 3-methyltransferase (glyoxalase superfamily)